MSEANEEFYVGGGEIVYDDNNIVENTQITNPEPAEIQTITRQKKPRSEKQLKALERARAKRLENLEKKKADMELLKASEIGGSGGVSLEINDVEEIPVNNAVCPSPPQNIPKKKKKKKVIVNNYYEESSDEEEIVNNYYYGKKKKVNINDTPQQINQYEPTDNVEYQVNNYTFNPYENMRFV